MNKESGYYSFAYDGEAGHAKNCDCPICNNGIREEHQYAGMEWKPGVIIRIDGYEWWLIDKLVKNKDESYKKFPELVADESKTPVLAYGVLMPSNDSEVTNWTEEMEKWKNLDMCTLEDGKIFNGCYTDIELFEDKLMYNEFIPCAMLLHMPYDLSVQRELGFGHTTFIRYTYAETKEHMDILDNVLNRPFILCIAEKEESFDGNVDNWRGQIDEKKLIQIARRLF